jgi:protein-S-isoprenylcysteine O-methyltransferase
MLAFSSYLILGCFAVFLLFWMVSAAFTKRTVQKVGRGRGFWILPIGGVLLIVLRLLHVPLFQHRALWPRTDIVLLLADMTALAGLLVTLWARVTLGANWSSNVTLKENHELIERGPYAYVRHPIYTGILLLILGAMIFDGSLSAILFLLFCMIGYWSKLKNEEKLMLEHFPDEYPKYKTRTKTLVPFLF